MRTYNRYIRYAQRQLASAGRSLLGDLFARAAMALDFSKGLALLKRITPLVSIAPVAGSVALA